MKLQQLYKSTQRKIDTIQDVRLRLARCLREQRMGILAARELLAAQKPLQNEQAHVEEKSAAILEMRKVRMAQGERK